MMRDMTIANLALAIKCLVSGSIGQIVVIMRGIKWSKGLADFILDKQDRKKDNNDINLKPQLIGGVNK